MYKKILGSSIKEHRINAGLSQEQVAARLQIARTTYLRYERGIHVPSLELLIEMSEIFNSGLYELIKPILVTDPNYKDVDVSERESNPLLSLQYNFQKLSNNEKSYILSIMHTLIAMHS